MLFALIKSHHPHVTFPLTSRQLPPNFRATSYQQVGTFMEAVRLKGIAEELRLVAVALENEAGLLLATRDTGGFHQMIAVNQD